jgi:hypothetical protein
MSSEPRETQPAQLPDIIAPKAGPDTPDKDTQKAPDYTGDYADGRVFHFSKWGIKYGVDDKGQAAALVISVLLIALLGICLLAGALVDRPWIADVFKLVIPALTFTAGVAIGKSGNSPKSK